MSDDDDDEHGGDDDDVLASTSPVVGETCPEVLVVDVPVGSPGCARARHGTRAW